MHVLLVLAVCYFGINFLMALVMHLHGLRQAHLPVRFMEVLMHFLLFSALALPVLLVTSAEAFFGREKQPRGPRGYQPVSQPQ